MSFETAFENVTPSGIGCTTNYFSTLKFHTAGGFTDAQRKPPEGGGKLLSGTQELPQF